MKRWFHLCLALLLGFGIGFQSMESLSHGQQAATVTNIPRDAGSFREVVKVVQPAVVSIETRGKVARVKQLAPRFRNDLPDEFRRFFPDMPDLPNDAVPQTGFGSGFFVDSSGIILTNAHVVADADQVTVTLHDGRKFTSKDVKSDSKTDLAIVVIDPKAGPFPFLELTDSDTYEIGDRVLAFGAPFGLTGSVTTGIVSAKGRSALSVNMYEDFIQTDAAINPGNSGGPLVGMDGRVLGINAAIKSRSGGFQGVGFAVSSNLAKNVVRALRADGIVHRGYLGVQIRDLQADVAETFGIPKGVGVVVGSVFEGSPAGKAGIEAGDIITAIEGRPIKDGRVLQMTVANLPLNKATNVEVYRDGKKIAVPVTVVEQPRDFGRADVPAPQRSGESTESQRLDKIGVEVGDLSDAEAKELGYREGARGVVITKVNPGPAADAGLAKGMLILKVAGRPVSTADELRQAISTADFTRGVVLQVQSPTGGVNYVVVRTTE